MFLELKRKIGGIVAKRRAVLHYEEALRFVATGVSPQTDNYQDRQVVGEIADFISRYPVPPKVYISYERVALFGKYDKEFRVSFDKNILTRRSDVNLCDGDYGAELLTDVSYLNEYVKKSSWLEGRNPHKNTACESNTCSNCFHGN